jgi:hypothetical protein
MLDHSKTSSNSVVPTRSDKSDGRSNPQDGIPCLACLHVVFPEGQRFRPQAERRSLVAQQREV